MHTRLFKKYFPAFILGVISIQIQAASKSIPTGIIENKACIECHEKNNPQLIKDWQISIHASTQPVTNCIACHGKLHQEAASHARRDSICIDCHGGKKAPVVHSYTSSKHGIIMQLEKIAMTGNNLFPWQTTVPRAVIIATCMKRIIM